MQTAEATLDRWRQALAPALADPESTAILSDLDGTIAPIVARPEQAAIPAEARSALERIASRYALCGIVTGRQIAVAREIVGLDGLAYAGNHGFEVQPADAHDPVPAPALDGHADDAREFLAAAIGADELEAAGIRVEDKGPIIGLHWRGAEDEPAAETIVDRIASRATKDGLIAHRGRKVVELRPAIAVDKGAAIEALLGGARVRTALYAGDDRTDVDGFRMLARMRELGRLDAVVRVAVRSPEGPPEVVESADLVVDGPAELVDLLGVLAG